MNADVRDLRSNGDGRRVPVWRRWRWQVGGAVAINALLFLAIFVVNPPDYGKLYVDDFTQYDDIAANLLAGNGFTLHGHPNIWRAPGYPVWLALVYRIAGHSITAVIVGQGFLTCIIVFLTALLGRQLLDERVGALAAYVAAFNPVIRYYAHVPLSEPFFTVICLASLIIVGPALGRTVWWRVILAGFIMGLATLVRPQTLILPGLLGIWWLWKMRWRGVMMTAVFTAVMWLPILPQTARNYVVTGEFMAVGGHTGTVLWVSNNDVTMSDSVYWGYNANPTRSRVVSAGPKDPISEQLRVNRERGEEALEFIRANWTGMPRLICYKLLRFFSIGAEISSLKKLVALVIDLPLLPLSITGIIILWKRGTPELGASLAIIFNTLIAISIFWGDSRFRFVITPYSIALASVALLHLSERARNSFR